MKKSVLTFTLLIVTLSLMATCVNKHRTHETSEVDIAAADNLAPDFELPNLEGTTTRLSSLRGKYVVLDFWGTWCPWCIRGIPNMKAYYVKYKDKMEILSVDFNDPEARWKRAVEYYKMPWMHVRCPNDQAMEVVAKYNLTNYPTKVVINPDGKVIKVVVGEKKEFYRFLDELFN